MTAAVTYVREPQLSAAEFRDVLMRSTLGNRRPINDDERLQRMLAEADIIVTARTAEGLLVGVSRALTDYAFCCYLSDLAVDVACQGHGIGRALLAQTHALAGTDTTLYLVAAPAAETYYPHIGMTHVSACWKTLPSRPET